MSKKKNTNWEKSETSTKEKKTESKKATVKKTSKPKVNRWEIIQKMKINNAVYLPGDKLSLDKGIMLPESWAKLLTNK